MSPVCGNLVFSPSIQCGLGIHLWRDLFYLIELKTVERQKGDFDFRDLLLRIRTGCHTPSDITVLEKNSNLCASRSAPDSAEVLHLYPKLKDCAKHNTTMLAKLSQTTPIYKINAEHVIFNVSKRGVLTLYSKQVDSKYLPEDDRECAGLAKDLFISINSVVM